MIFIDAEEVASSFSRGSSALVVHTPFNRAFVDALKEELPRSYRRWSPGDRAWKVIVFAFKDLITILEEHFPDYQIDYSAEAIAVIEQKHPRYFKDGGYGVTRSPGSGSTPHDTLFIQKNAPMCVIVAAYKALSRENHPDMGGDRDSMAKINNAFDEIKRR